jgi:hypothetical protein
LVSASDGLALDPYSKNEKKRLMDALRGLLDGSKQILLSFEAAEVRKILKESGLVKSGLVGLLGHHQHPLSPTEFKDTFTNFSKALMTLIQLCRRHCKELLKEELEIELRTRTEGLEQLAPSFLSASRLFMIDGKTQLQYDLMEALSNQISLQCTRIEAIVKYSSEEDEVRCQLSAEGHTLTANFDRPSKIVPQYPLE